MPVGPQRKTTYVSKASGFLESTKGGGFREIKGVTTRGGGDTYSGSKFSGPAPGLQRTFKTRDRIVVERLFSEKPQSTIVKRPGSGGPGSRGY